MDGFAVRAADIQGASGAAPVLLRIAGRTVAGDAAAAPLEPGDAVRIMTGAPLPRGADAVVMQEVTRVEGETVLVLEPVRPRVNVRARGAEVQVGSTALSAGSLLGPAQIALLAAVGRSQVAVHRRPRVAIVSTGDELCSLDAIAFGRVVDSNGYGLAALVRCAGGEPVQLGIARDDRADIARALEAARCCDAVITSGGASVGERDCVRDALASHGVELKFWRVAMKPGKPLAFGVRGATPFFGLPGNPTSSMVSFSQFVAPALRKLAGHGSPAPLRLRARLGAALAKPQGLTHFVRAQCTTEDGRLVARPVARQDSGIISSLAGANALIVLPPELERAEVGEEVLVQLLENFEGRT